MIEFFFAERNSTEYKELVASSVEDAIKQLPEQAAILFRIDSHCVSPVWTNSHVPNHATVPTHPAAVPQPGVSA